VTRPALQEVLEHAAISQGLPPERFRLHSQRLGGATALWHITGDLAIVKRLGRWASDAVHGYLWDGAEQNRGLSDRMALDTTRIHVAADTPGSLVRELKKVPQNPTSGREPVVRFAEGPAGEGDPSI